MDELHTRLVLFFSYVIYSCQHILKPKGQPADLLIDCYGVSYNLAPGHSEAFVTHCNTLKRSSAAAFGIEAAPQSLLLQCLQDLMLLLTLDQ